jgi:homoserine dehydrogenase
VDVFVEVMGGHDGPAKAATEAAIAAGKDVVTANKALLAHHGQALAEAAEAAGRVIRFEAAVAGRHPGDQGLTEGLAGNRITRDGRDERHLQLYPDPDASAGLPYERCSRKPASWAIWRPTRTLMWAASTRATS